MAIGAQSAYYRGVLDEIFGIVIAEEGCNIRKGFTSAMSLALGGDVDNGVWDDLQGDVSQAKGNSALTLEAFRDTLFSMLFSRHDQSDSLSFSFQMPHSWLPGTQVNPHVHFVPMGDPLTPQNIRFSGSYAWVSPGTVIPANVGWTAFTADYVVNPGDVYKESIVGLGYITPPPTSGESDILLLVVRRDGVSAADTYTTSKATGTAAANVGLLSVDVHIRKSKSGTEIEYGERG